MKKLLAVLLSVLCVASCFGLGASAADDLTGNLTGDLTAIFEKVLDVELPEEETIGYGVIYDMQDMSFVSVMYKPTPSVSFSNPGTYTITSDTPLSVDYQFVCWRHSETGKLYYAGDKLYVDGLETLYAVWEEKTDNDIRVVRVIKTALETFKRTIGKFLGILDDFAEFEEDLNNPVEKPVGTIILSSENIGLLYNYETNPRAFAIYILTNEYGTFNANYATSTVTFGEQSYPVELNITDETGNVNGVPYQFIKVNFVDGVPSPERGVRMSFVIPEGFLVNAEGKINVGYAGSFLTSRYV